MNAPVRAEAARLDAAVMSRPPMIQRACSCGERAGVSGDCPSCAARKRAGIRPGPAVSCPGDRWEQEADRITDAVVSEQRVALRGPLPAPIALQRQPEREDDEDEPIRRAEAGSAPPASASAPAAAARAVASGGRPLSASERGYFEPRFGRDFASVRIHESSAAASAARGIGAHAYTLGTHIALASGAYDFATTRGRRLMAHELAHTLQQAGHTIRRACSPPGTCAAPIAGNPEDFSSSEAAREAGPRARRKGMTPTRARSSGHAGRARQLEILLRGHDPTRLALLHGIFIDADVSSNTAAFVTNCATWAADSLPAGDPDPSGLRGAVKPCMFVPGQLNREAFDFNQGQTTVGGRPAAAWRAEALNTLIHETEHVRFDTSIQPGLALPAAVTSPACTKAAVEFNLSEIVAIVSEFPLHFDAAQAEASASGPAHTRLNNYLTQAVSGTGESFTGALTAMGCKCNCPEVDALVIQAVDAATTGFSATQKTGLRTALRARMPGPARPLWPAAPTP